MSGRVIALDADGRLSDRTLLDDPRIGRVLALLDTEGEQARLVGGAVRNALLGRAPGDIDIATTALPEVVLARAKAARLRAIPTGIAHGTVTLMSGGLPLEVTTLREDVETDGRHAVVRFGRSFERDAERRDFTINALSLDADGTVHDTTGGLVDLRAGRLRFIGDARTRIREDYLRILRFFRFSADYAEGSLDDEGVAACTAEAAGLRRLSRERVRGELFKLLVGRRAPDIVAVMGRANLLDLLLDRPSRPPRFARYRAIVATRDEAPDPVLGLAALALTGERDVSALREVLRLSNAERDRLATLSGWLQLAPPTTPSEAQGLSTLLYECGRPATLDILTLWHVNSGATPDDRNWQAAHRFAQIADIPTLPVSGADIVARGVSRGPHVGETLKRLQASWIRAGFPVDPAQLHALLDDAIVAARLDDAG